MPASPQNSLCWNLAKPKKSVRVNDLEDYKQGGCHLMHRGSSRERGGWWWEYNKEICLNLAAHNLAHCNTTNDIILPWKESWWKFAAGSQLPTGGFHALWLENNFFHWALFFSSCSSSVNFTVFIKVSTTSACSYAYKL